LKFNTKYILLIISILIVGSIIYYLSDIVSYVMIAWALSMIGAPLITFLRKFTGKTAAALITLLCFSLVFMGLIWIFIPPLVTQAKNLANIDYNNVVNVLEEPVRDWKNWLIEKRLILDDQSSDSTLATQSQEDQWVKADQIAMKTDSGGIFNTIAVTVHIDKKLLDGEAKSSETGTVDENDFFTNFRTNIIRYINPANIQLIFSSAMSKFGNLLVGILSVFFISFFFLKEQGLFDKMITAAVPEQYEMQTHQAIDETSKLLIRYFIGILIQMIIITVFVSTALSLLGVKNALLIGFFAAVMNVIPYIGPILGAAFAAMITISSNLDLSFYNALVPLVTKVLLVFAVMQIIDNIILQPNIFSKSVKAHPLEIFLVVMIGAKIAGILGMVLAIPFYTAFRVIGKVFLSEFKVIQELTKNI
jgi:predicted PurR-regulated permease PerM